MCAAEKEYKSHSSHTHPLNPPVVLCRPRARLPSGGPLMNRLQLSTPPELIVFRLAGGTAWSVYILEAKTHAPTRQSSMRYIPALSPIFMHVCGDFLSSSRVSPSATRTRWRSTRLRLTTRERRLTLRWGFRRSMRDVEPRLYTITFVDAWAREVPDRQRARAVYWHAEHTVRCEEPADEMTSIDTKRGKSSA